MMKVLILLLAIWSINTQSCLNHNGQAVDWYVLLHAPRTVSDGYLYFDSLKTSPTFTKYT